MTSSSITLIVAVIFFCLLYVFSFHYINQKQLLQNNTKSKILFYWAIITLVVFCFGRYLFNWIDFINGQANGVEQQIAFQQNRSKILFLDLCPFLTIALPVSQLVARKSIFSRYLAVVGIFCGTITLFGCLYLKEAGWDLGWMFIGQNGNQLFFLIHLNLVFYGCTILLLQPAKFQPQAFVEVIYLPSVYLLYVLITKTIFQVKYNVTGLSSDEWSNTSFGQYHRLFQTFNLNYPGIFWLCFFLSVIFVWLIISLHNLRYHLICYFYQKKHQQLLMATKYESPIAHLVKNYDHQNKPHWEGNLTFQQFQQAYWTLVWKESSIWGKCWFIFGLFFFFYFPAMIVQFLYKRAYCRWHQLGQLRVNQKLLVFSQLIFHQLQYFCQKLLLFMEVIVKKLLKTKAKLKSLIYQWTKKHR